jgi:hypothetical protein
MVTTLHRPPESRSPHNKSHDALDRDFERLRGAAVRLLDTHVRRGAVCAGCGRAWPCDLVLLAAQNLTLVGDTAPARSPVPPPDRTTAPADTSGNHAVSPAQPVVSRAAGSGRTPPAAPAASARGPLSASVSGESV